MTEEQFHVLMIAIGFGFGSIFWLVLFALCLFRR